MPPQDEDSARFRRAIGEIRRHRSDRATAARKPPLPQPRQSERDDADVVRTLLSHPIAPEELETGEELYFARPGTSRATMRKLRRGEFVVEAEIDLHGLNTKESLERLTAFFADAKGAGIRCARIVHGKGLRSPDSRPVLKLQADQWLRRRNDVLGFCSARPEDGGTGAMYVLLQKR